MQRASKTAIEETGINYLHLAIGFVSWRARESSGVDLLSKVIIGSLPEMKCLDPTTLRRSPEHSPRTKKGTFKQCFAAFICTCSTLSLPGHANRDLANYIAKDMRPSLTCQIPNKSDGKLAVITDIAVDIRGG